MTSILLLYGVLFVGLCCSLKIEKPCRKDDLIHPNTEASRIEEEVLEIIRLNIPSSHEDNDASKRPNDHENPFTPQVLAMVKEKMSQDKLDEPVYAFNAQLSTDTVIAGGSPVIFDTTITNEGSLYFNTSGQFACVDNGVYFFTWVIRNHRSSTHGDRCTATLNIGADILKFGPRTSFSDNTYSGTAQMSALVQCRTSPLSAVTVTSADYSTPVPRYGPVVTTFSGFRLASSAEAVGFTAELSNDTNIIPGGKIVFNTAISNFGNHYDSLHGFFRCPDDSLYVFYVSTQIPSAREAPYQWTSSRLMFHGDTVLYGPMSYAATNEYDAGSTSVTAVLQCQQGKDVYVEAHDTYNFTANTYGAELTSFSGFRLYNDSWQQQVAFTAVLSQNVSEAGYLVLDNVITNIGDCYNSTSGVFTCPDDLLYMFTWSGASATGRSYLYLRLNDLDIQHNWMTDHYGSDSTGTSGTCSQSHLIRCSTGATLRLHVSDNAANVVLADYTMFSGYRIPGQE